VSTNFERSPHSTEAITLRDSGDLELSPANEPTTDATTQDLTPQTVAALATLQPVVELAATPETATPDAPPTLASLLPGARLVLRCRKDWRAASVAAIEPDCVRLNVASPSGYTYRVRRPHDSPLTFDGSIPVLGAGDRAVWRVSLARYDGRW
jgi:hypothetical protein